MKKWVKKDSQYASGSSGRTSAAIAREKAAKAAAAKKVIPQNRKKGDSLSNKRR
jgi:hypothetical protein